MRRRDLICLGNVKIVDKNWLTLTKILDFYDFRV